MVKPYLSAIALSMSAPATHSRREAPPLRVQRVLASSVRKPVTAKFRVRNRQRRNAVVFDPDVFAQFQDVSLVDSRASSTRSDVFDSGMNDDDDEDEQNIETELDASQSLSPTSPLTRTPAVYDIEPLRSSSLLRSRRPSPFIQTFTSEHSSVNSIVSRTAAQRRTQEAPFPSSVFIRVQDMQLGQGHPLSRLASMLGGDVQSVHSRFIEAGTSSDDTKQARTNGDIQGAELETVSRFNLLSIQPYQSTTASVVDSLSQLCLQPPPQKSRHTASKLVRFKETVTTMLHDAASEQRAGSQRMRVHSRDSKQ